jgi:hypothetical protein
LLLPLFNDPERAGLSRATGDKVLFARIRKQLLPPTSTQCGTRGQLFEIVKMEERETWTARFLRTFQALGLGVVLIDFDGVRF